MKTFPALRAGCAGAALAIACAAQAADPAKPAAKPAAPKSTAGFGTRATGPLLTREELRACLATQERSRTQADAVTRQRAALDAEKAELLKQGEALKEALATLDRTSQEAVDAYNARASARDQRIGAYEAAVDQYNAAVEALKGERDGFARQCENRRYDEADEIALRGGR